MTALETFGDTFQYALPVGAGLHAIYRGHTKEGLSLGVAAAIQHVVLHTIKYITESPRPFPNHLRLDSFPSGHTAGAFLAVGFTFALDYMNTEKPTTFYKTCLTGAAILVGVSRYTCSMHWVVDIVVGSLLGLFFGSASVLLSTEKTT